METTTVEIVVVAPFKFAHGGHQVEAFEPIEGDVPQATTPECAALAIAEGWARPVQASAPAPEPTPAPEPAPAPVPAPAPAPSRRRAAAAAPSNKDAAEQRSPADPA